MRNISRLGLATMGVTPLLTFPATALAQETPALIYGPLGAATAIPVNNPLALALVSLLIMVVGFVALRRSGVRGDRFLTVALPVLSGALLVASLTGPQVSQAIMPPLQIELDRPGGGKAEIRDPGLTEFVNTSGITQVILEINLPDCGFFPIQASSTTSDASPQCEARGTRGAESGSVDTLAAGERCWINVGVEQSIPFFGDDVQPQLAKPSGPLCRIRNGGDVL